MQDVRKGGDRKANGEKEDKEEEEEGKEVSRSTGEKQICTKEKEGGVRRVGRQRQRWSFYIVGDVGRHDKERMTEVHPIPPSVSTLWDSFLLLTIGTDKVAQERTMVQGKKSEFILCRDGPCRSSVPLSFLAVMDIKQNPNPSYTFAYSQHPFSMYEHNPGVSREDVMPR